MSFLIHTLFTLPSLLPTPSLSHFLFFLHFSLPFLFCFPPLISHLSLFFSFSLLSTPSLPIPLPITISISPFFLLPPYPSLFPSQSLFLPSFYSLPTHPSSHHNLYFSLLSTPSLPIPLPITISISPFFLLPPYPSLFPSQSLFLPSFYSLPTHPSSHHNLYFSLLSTPSLPIPLPITISISPFFLLHLTDKSTSTNGNQTMDTQFEFPSALPT